jgi:hypothetical protein
MFSISCYSQSINARYIEIDSISVDNLVPDYFPNWYSLKYYDTEIPVYIYDSLVGYRRTFQNYSRYVTNKKTGKCLLEVIEVNLPNRNATVPANQSLIADYQRKYAPTEQFIGSKLKKKLKEYAEDNK